MTRGASVWLKRVAVAMAALVLSVALVCGLMRAGSRYFYCDAMGMLATDPCARLATDKDDPGGAAFYQHHADCCAELALPAMPEGTTLLVRSVPPAAVVALRPAALVFPVRPAPAPRVFERWRAPPRPPGEARARLMVFLT